MIERGIILPDPNPQQEIQKHSENADWEYKDQAAYLYRIGGMMMGRFFNGLVYLDGRKMPDPLIAFENLRNNNVLAQYDLHPDEYGLMYKITFNTAHFIDKEGTKEYKYGRWAMCETLTHEMLHAWQQHGRGNHPYKSGRNTHNKEFVTKAKELGLNVVPVYGAHYQVADEGSPFAILMKELGIERPNDVPRAEGVKVKDDWFEIGKKRKGRSSLTKYTCGCQNAWIGAAEFAATCDKCGNEFVKATALRQILYDLASMAPPESTQTLELDRDEIDMGSILDQMQERFEEEQEEAAMRAVDEFEDIGMYLDQYSNQDFDF